MHSYDLQQPSDNDDVYSIGGNMTSFNVLFQLRLEISLTGSNVRLPKRETGTEHSSRRYLIDATSYRLL